jgi:hypothetical protein
LPLVTRLAGLVVVIAIGALTVRAQTDMGTRPSRPDRPQFGSPRVPAPAPSRQVVMPLPGESFDTEYYFDHNALRQAVRAGRSIVAMTASGNLMRFDLATFALTGELVVKGRATALAPHDDARVLVGTEDGRVSEVSVDSWAVSPKASVTGSIIWIGAFSTGVVAAVRAPRGDRPWPGEPGESYRRRQRSDESNAERRDRIIVINGRSTRSFSIADKGRDIDRAVFAVDKEDGVWIGTDFGEFGGGLKRLDLKSGTVREFKFHGNVGGFVTGDDGTTFAYGGVSHLGMEEGYVARLGADSPKVVTEFDNKNPSSPSIPSGPIDRVIRAADGGGFWAVSNHRVFRVDPSMTMWSQTALLGGRWISGRAASMGNTPTANAVLSDPAHPSDLIVAMGRDGLVRVENSGETQSMFEGQLEIEATDIWSGSVGPLLLTDIRESPAAWRLGSNGWNGVFFDDVESAARDGWYMCAIAGDDGKSVITICEGPSTPGDRAIFRVGADSRADVLERWKGEGSALWGWLLSSSGQAVDTEDGALRVRDRGDWRTVGKITLPSDVDTMGALPERRFLPLDQLDDVAYFLDASRGSIVKLTERPLGSMTLSPADYSGKRIQNTQNIWDVCPDGDHWVLIASHRGLTRMHLTDGETRPISPPNGTDEITTLTRDKQGHLWAAGNAIYVSADDGMHWSEVDLPMSGPTSSKRIRPSPDAPRGVWISLGDRGFVIVR